MRTRWLLVVVFVVGSASLGAEIAAARLLAPWFGASTIVWANTIATVLVALSIGYALGGRLADRRPHLAGLSAVVLASSLLLAVVPFVSSPFLRESTRAFQHRSGGLFLGSLLGVGVLIAVPVLLLGMVSPYAVRLAVRDLADTGRTAGRLYAVGTVGSLTGTFAAALLLIPLAGTRRTFLAFALALALVALPGLARLRPAAVLVAALIGGLMFVPVGTTKPARTAKVLAELDSEYQYARVLEEPDGTRLLELNEGQAVHSVYRPGGYVTGGYWGAMAVLAHAGSRPVRRVAVLGSAAGTIPRTLTHFWPRLQVDAVELDPAVTELGRKYFDLEGSRIHTHAGDARPWLQATGRRFDAILLDAYRQPYIPFYLTTREFFAEVRRHLRPGGVMLINVGHPADSDALEKVLSATARSVYGGARVWRDRVNATSTVLVATTDGTDPAARMQQLAATGPAGTSATATAAAAVLAPALRGGDVYTDDRAPVEWLIDTSLAAEAR